MYVRLSFDNGNRIKKEELGKLSDTLSDNIKHSPLYKDGDGDFRQFYTYSYTLDPNDPQIAEGKKKLLFPTEFVELDSDKEYFAELDLFLVKHPSIKIKIRGMVKSVEKNFTGMIEEIQYIYNKLEESLKKFDKNVEFNEKCDVHIANLGLLNINQLGYIEDACTENLQDILNKGWRILAVCVQSDSRRPDYILGRYNPDQDAGVNCVKF